MMFRRRAACLCPLVISFLLVVHAPLTAQVASGEITGLITDRSGAALPGVTVTVTDNNTHRQRVVVTTIDGAYAAVGLLPGIYPLRVTLNGFAPVVQDRLQVTTGQKIRLDLTLVVGQVSEEVTVRGDTPILRAESA